MKTLFFCRYSIDKASSRVRGFYVAEELARRGFEVDVVWGASVWVYVKFLFKAVFSDVVIFQKHYTFIDVYLNRFLRWVGKKTIFDIDDAPFGTAGRERTERQVCMMMQLSSGVTAASHALAEYAKEFSERVYVVPTSIRLEYYEPRFWPKRSKDKVVLGWIGNGPGYKEDLRKLVEPIKALGEKYRIRLVIIGAMGDKQIYKDFADLGRAEVEIIDSIEWSRAGASAEVIEQFDIGLYPLVRNEYNKYKGGFKALEYMALGVPVVGSAVGETKYIIEHGTDGFFADGANEWIKYLGALIGDSNLRRQFGEAGRAKIERKYSMEAAGEIFEGIVKEIWR